MKKKLITVIRLALSALVLYGWYKGIWALFDLHYTSCPELHIAPLRHAPLYLGLAAAILLLPLPATGITLLSGYRLHRFHWLFLEITRPDKLHIRLTKKPGWTIRMLPPRTDGTSPYVVYWCAGDICMAALALILGLLTVLLWRTPAARYLLIAFPAVLVWVFLMPLLPTKRSPLDRVLAFRRSRDLRRAWECNMHVTAAGEKKEKLEDMPEEWFLPYPAELADHPIVRYANFNRASRLINQDRYAEGYEALQYFFDLKPTPVTKPLVAGAILNGALCEGLGDLPPMCLSQLDHPVLKHPLPKGWQTQYLYAEYTRALFLHHDEQEAAAILPKLEAALDRDGRSRNGLDKLQRKAGLLTGNAPAIEGDTP